MNNKQTEVLITLLIEKDVRFLETTALWVPSKTTPHWLYGVLYDLRHSSFIVLPDDTPPRDRVSKTFGGYIDPTPEMMEYYEIESRIFFNFAYRIKRFDDTMGLVYELY